MLVLKVIKNPSIYSPLSDFGWAGQLTQVRVYIYIYIYIFIYIYIYI